MNKQQRKEYEEQLTKKQKEHLERVAANKKLEWKPCLHDECSQCHGTFVKHNGSRCFHFISCNCPKCQNYYSLSLMET